MEEYFVTRSSAVAWVVAERQGLVARADEPAHDAADSPHTRLEELTQLLFDVRAGRVASFLLPTARGTVRIHVTAD